MSSYEKMKAIGQIVAQTLYEIKSFIQPGVTTKQIDDECARILNSYGAQSSAMNYGRPPFPGNVCVSVNHEVCHGVPGNKIIQSGDIVSVDIVANKDGYHGDSCYTFLLAPESNDRRFVVKHAYECMWNAISIIKDGVRVGDLGYAMESYAVSKGLNVIKDFCGHGIETKMHDEPQVPFYGVKGTGLILRTGKYITIEPMLVNGKNKIYINQSDGWTAMTHDRSLSAQFEHTILIKDNGYEVMTFNEFDKMNGKIRSID
jgi:methionyl aminopeptidase